MITFLYTHPAPIMLQHTSNTDSHLGTVRPDIFIEHGYGDEGRNGLKVLLAEQGEIQEDLPLYFEDLPSTP